MRVIFAEVLKKLRTEKGLSQRELAERLFVTRSTVARWENGSRLPDASMISRLSRCLNADFSTLLSIAAENETRTRDPNLGKVVLYQLSYFRMATRTRLELVTSAVTGRHSNQLNHRAVCHSPDVLELYHRKTKYASYFYVVLITFHNSSGFLRNL